MSAKQAKRHVIIYLPTGKQIQYTNVQTVADMDNNILICEVIECDEKQVNIIERVDGKIEGYAYVGMPYLLNMWD